MASITVLSLGAVALGLFLSVLFGRASSAEPIGCTAGALASIFIGIGLCFAAGVSHAFCHGVLKICAPTSDTNVWSVSYPLMAIPLYWVIMLNTPGSGKSGVEKAP
jgi:hypothetical protein